MKDAERIRMVEELTEDQMHNVNYMEAMNMLFNLFAMEFDSLDDDTLESRYLSRFGTSTEVH
jgi:hypothetical protein|tara:strand:- start:305 stop:490 length:186 start_codon:yes stop_codon:yes gene_type:complete